MQRDRIADTDTILQIERVALLIVL